MNMWYIFVRFQQTSQNQSNRDLISISMKVENGTEIHKFFSESYERTLSVPSQKCFNNIKSEIKHSLIEKWIQWIQHNCVIAKNTIEIILFQIIKKKILINEIDDPIDEINVLIKLIKYNLI